MIKNVFKSVIIVIAILLFSATLIAWGKGYRFNFREKSLTSTGILSASSSPDGASVFLNGKLSVATNGSISIPPDFYTVRITKEGYQSWEKSVRIQGEVVTRIEALLIPTNPSLRTLTITGVYNPVLSPSGGRVAYIVPAEEATYSGLIKPKKGIWVFELRNGTLGGKIEPRQIYQSDKIDWLNSTIIWSPDEKQIVLKVKKKDNKKEVILTSLEIFLDNGSSPPIDITSSWEALISEWNTTQSIKDSEVLNAISPILSQELETAARDIRFSPDDTKILFFATGSAVLKQIINPPLIGSNSTKESRSLVPGNYYIYDIKEDKNFQIFSEKTITSPHQLTWYTDSKHIITIENNSIYITDYDGTNKRVIYSGPFSDNIVFPWSTPGKLVILTNINRPKDLPNLYEIDLR